MQFTTLQTTSLEEIRLTFNEAFKEYLVPVYLSPEQLAQKLLVEGYAPHASVGAFKGDQLAGLILHATGSWKGRLTAYNCGTGVMAAFRGQQLTQRMFAHIIPLLQEMGIQSSLLEVIEGNDRALRSYTAVGFGAVRELDSFKGYIPAPKPDPEVTEIPTPDWEQLQQFWDWQPSWQHTPACLQRAEGSYKTYAIRQNQVPVAYATINPLTNRIPSFGVAPALRRRGLAKRLFGHLQYLYGEKPLTVINAAATATETTSFLQAAGLQYFLRQYEMELGL